MVTGKLFQKGPQWAAGSRLIPEEVIEKAGVLSPAFSVHGDLILGNSSNEAKGFTDKARQISNGSIPFRTPV